MLGINSIYVKFNPSAIERPRTASPACSKLHKNNTLCRKHYGKRIIMSDKPHLLIVNEFHPETIATLDSIYRTHHLWKLSNHEKAQLIKGLEGKCRAAASACWACEKCVYSLMLLNGQWFHKWIIDKENIITQQDWHSTLGTDTGGRVTAAYNSYLADRILLGAHDIQD